MNRDPAIRQPRDQIYGCAARGLTAMIAGLAPRARCFDPRLSWRGPFGRTKVRPILLPAKLSYHDKKQPKERSPVWQKSRGGNEKIRHKARPTL